MTRWIDHTSGSRNLAFYLAAALSLFLAATPLAAQLHYTVTDVGAVNDLNDNYAGASSINNAGVVAGQSILPSGPDRAFVWMNGQMFDLGSLGGPESGSHCINERGQIVGGADNSDGIELAFSYRGSGLIALGTFGGPNSEAQSINARGQIVGYASTTIPDPTQTTGPTESHAFLTKQGGTLTDLGTLGGPNSIAIGNNSRGQIVGWSQIDFNIGNFGMPDLHPAMWIDEVPTLLPRLGGSVTLAIHVNDEGVAVGQAFVADDSTFHAVLWKDGSIQDLGTLAGDYASVATGVNNRGQVVGTSFDPNFSPRAFVMDLGQMYDLNTLIPADSGWMLIQANNINASGQIVGNGFLNGSLHGFLLTPDGNQAQAAPVRHSSTSRPLTNTELSHLIWGRTALLKHGSRRH